MFNEEFLRDLGFRDFVHLRKEKRDSLKRLTTIKIIDGQWFTIQLVKRANWDLEKIIFDGDKKIYDKYFTKDPSLEDVIFKLFVQKND